MPEWTVAQVASLAPDASSLVAARGLSGPGPWSATGADDRAVWGRCRGYAVAVEVGREPERPLERGAGGRRFSCTCPSRKVPCKHALALLLLWTADPQAVPPGAAPGWVAEWLDSREARAARAETTSATDRKPVDPEARARRVAERAARIGAGLEELDLWLRDLVRQGLASASGRPFRYWDEAAARMVDAQAPGVGNQIRRLAGTVRGGGDWPGRLLVQAGRLYLVAEAWSKFDSLEPETQADLRTVAGWAWTSEEVRAGRAVRDRWAVVAASVVEEERFRIQRTWLVGAATAVTALILEFSAMYEPPSAELVPGTVVDADLAFHPGAWRQRALVTAVHGEPEIMANWQGSASFGAARDEAARALAANPWVDRLPLVVSEVVPVARGTSRLARDRDGAAVPLLVDDQGWWILAAVSGGRPVGLAGEWHDDGLRPLSVWSDRRLTALA
jgi:hypothetical protein